MIQWSSRVCNCRDTADLKKLVRQNLTVNSLSQKHKKTCHGGACQRVVGRIVDEIRNLSDDIFAIPQSRHHPGTRNMEIPMAFFDQCTLSRGWWTRESINTIVTKPQVAQPPWECLGWSCDWELKHLRWIGATVSQTQSLAQPWIHFPASPEHLAINSTKRHKTG